MVIQEWVKTYQAFLLVFFDLGFAAFSRVEFEQAQQVGGRLGLLSHVLQILLDFGHSVQDLVELSLEVRPLFGCKAELLLYLLQIFVVHDCFYFVAYHVESLVVILLDVGHDTLSYWVVQIGLRTVVLGLCYRYVSQIGLNS